MYLICLTRKSGYTTRRIEEATAAAGHRCQTLDPSRMDLLVGSESPLVGVNVSGPPDQTAIFPRLGALPPEHFMSVVRHFEGQGIRSFNSSDAILRARDKLIAYQQMAASGVAVPKTLVMSDQRNFDTVKANIPGPPYIFKLPVGVQGIGVMLAETDRSAKSILDTFWGLNDVVLVQEFIPEAVKDTRVFVVDGRVVASMKRAATAGDFRSNVHQRGTAEACLLSAAEEDIALRASKALNLDIAGVDIAHSGGTPVVIEVNQSPGFESLEDVTGIDCASPIIQMIAQNLGE